ncbi:hypothetical protein ACWEQL_32930 [Kitasatospora sp. NPDC004240]
MSRSTVPEPAWWYEDPQRWELLDFEASRTADGLPVDIRRDDRREVLEAIALAPEACPGDFARHLLIQETHHHGHAWGFAEAMEIAALLVARQRRVEDVWLLWSAVCRSFDTWFGVPHRLLLAAGVARTAAYLEASDHSQRDNLADHLRSLATTTDADVERTLADRLWYYRESLIELAAD